MSDQKTMTLEEVAATFSIDIPDWQKAANLEWLRGIHDGLREGGAWGSPALGTIYRKHGSGFVLDLDLS